MASSGTYADSPALQIEFAQASDVGRVRDHNEDYLGSFQPATSGQAQSHGWLFVVADGVGGQEMGEVASRTAVESVTANFRDSAGGESHAALLRRLVQAANQEVYEAGHAAAPGGVAMATTIVACALRYDRAVVAHVGDSRCYLVRGGSATQLTRDHTVTAEQMRLGILSAQEAAESAHRHILSRSLGAGLFVSVDTADQQMLAGDTFLLCSDGLHNAVEGADLARILKPTAPLAEAVQELVALANQRDGGDNITLQAIRVRGVERVGMYRGRPYRLR